MCLSGSLCVHVAACRCTWPHVAVHGCLLAACRCWCSRPHHPHHPHRPRVTISLTSHAAHTAHTAQISISIILTIMFIIRPLGADDSPDFIGVAPEIATRACWVVPCPGSNGTCSDGERVSVYETSFYHQSTEFVLPMVDAAVRSKLAPEVIWWRFPMLPITLGMFEAAFPDTLIVTGTESEQHFFCSREKHVVTWRPFSDAAKDHKSTWTPASASPAMKRSIDVVDMLKGVTETSLRSESGASLSGPGQLIDAPAVKHLREAVYSKCGITDTPPGGIRNITMGDGSAAGVGGGRVRGLRGLAGAEAGAEAGAGAGVREGGRMLGRGGQHTHPHASLQSIELRVRGE